MSSEVRREIDLSSGRISYLRAGTGPATILLHTIGGSAAEYERLLPRLKDDLDVIAVDLPGHAPEACSHSKSSGYSLGFGGKPAAAGPHRARQTVRTRRR